VAGNGTGATYTITQSDIGYAIVDEQTADDGSGAAVSSSGPTDVVAPPSNSAPPSVSGSPRSGGTLTTTTGSWDHTPSFSYQWMDCGADASSCTPVQSGGTSSSYAVQPSDAGQAIEVQVKACDDPNQALSCATANSAPVGFPIASNQPAISGLGGQGHPVQGSPVTDVHASWAPDPDGYAYQWFACSGGNCAAIAGATAQSYTPTLADAGSTLEVQEAASFHGTSGDPDVSSQTATVLPLPPVNTAAPTVSGTTTQGQTLTASPGSWSNSPTRYAYQWFDCNGGGCAAIAGATGQTYTLGAGDVGDSIIVQVSASNAGGTSAIAGSAATATVQTTSSISLTTTPAAPVTNQTITLAATISAGSSQAQPTGTISFAAGGRPVSGCQNVSVSASGPTATVLCQATFAAGDVLLSASYAPSASANVLSSTSPTRTIAVGQDSTTTGLDVSSRVAQSKSTTFTATVATPSARSGRIQPGGVVQFRDGNAPIAACARQPLVNGAATCTVSYADPGVRVILAHYLGDENFAGSVSGAKRLNVTGPATRGSITATMQWTFHFTPHYTQVMAMTVNGMPVGSTVRTNCGGHGCPFKTRRHAVTRRCTVKKGKRRCAVPARFAAAPWFRRRHLGVGATVTVLLTKRQFVGKYYRFTIRARRQPKVRIACLAPGSTAPGKGCR
jgi:hypothetical protein